MRSGGIEIKINLNQIPQEIIDSGVLDIEYSSKKGYDILWIHDDGFKPFLEEHFQHLAAAEEAYNRKTKTDHLNIYLETEDELGEYDEQIDDIKYKNIKFSELETVDLAKVKFKRNLKDK
jgi:hypothetical protein